MKKTMSRVGAALFACVLCFSMLLPVSAASNDLGEGTSIAPAAIPSGTSQTLFPLTAAHVTDFLCSQSATSGDKYFVPNNYKEFDSVLVKGKLTHTATGTSIRTGVCRWDKTLKKYLPIDYREYASGDPINFGVAIDKMLGTYRNEAHFGYIKNIAGAGYVSGGTITFSAYVY